MREQETWKAVPGFPDYEVSDLGRVRTYRQPRILRSRGRRCVYRHVVLRNETERRSDYVHRLVLLAFQGPPPGGCEACHNDGNRHNNRLDNLRWDTRLANVRDKRKHGTERTGENHQMARVTRAEAEEIIGMLKRGLGVEEIAGRYGIKADNVKRIRNGRHWAVREASGTPEAAGGV